MKRNLKLVLIIAIISVISFSFSTNKTNDNPKNSDVFLNKLIGTWEAISKDDEGERKELWTLDWSTNKTHLELNVVSSFNDNPFATGYGFIVADSTSHEYRIYLMMDNGAMHESVGIRNKESEIDFILKTYGNVNFPDLKCKFLVNENTMTTKYTSLDDKEYYTLEFSKIDD